MSDGPKTGNVVIADDSVYAGINEEDRCEVRNALVIAFKDPDGLRQAIRNGQAAFKVFGSEHKPGGFTHASD